MDGLAEEVVCQVCEPMNIPKTTDAEFEGTRSQQLEEEVVDYEPSYNEAAAEPESAPSIPTETCLTCPLKLNVGFQCEACHAKQKGKARC